MNLSQALRIGLGALILAAPAAAQESGAVERGTRLARERTRKADVLVPAETMNQRSPIRASATPMPVRQANTVNLGPEAAADANSPRPILSASPLPFGDDRPALEVNGAVITTGMLNELVAYYRTFKSGADALLVRDAIEALVPGLVVRQKYAEHLPALEKRIQEARAQLEAGVDFAAVVAEYSDDDEAPTPDGRYTFGREVAVQPFDRYAHSSPVGAITPPFLTRYGYHVLQVVSYDRGEEARTDKSEVRHVLAMYPFEGEDPRREIQDLVNSCKIRVLEPGFRNAVPPELRARIVP